MRSSCFTAMRTATDGNPMIAIQKAHAFGLSCSDRLMIACWNAHAFGPSSILARMKMKTTPRSLAVAMTKMMVASCLLDLVLLSFNFARKLLKCSSRTDTRKVPRQICWSYPKISVLELQNSSGLTNVIIWRSNHRIASVLRFWINPPIRRPQLALKLLEDTSWLPNVSFRDLTSRKLLQSFLIIMGPAGFLHKKIAMRQQSRSSAARS